MSVGKYFIGGLARDVTTTDSLRQYFELFGQLSDVIVMTKDGQSRGFGFVTFADPATIPPDFLSSVHIVDGKQVDVKPAVPEEQMAPVQPAVKKLFLGGLSPATTQADLEAHFSQFGVLTDAVVMQTNGQPRGFGFVTFQTPEEADAACYYPGGHVIQDKQVDVKKAEPKGSPGLARPGQNRGYSGAVYGRFGGHRAPGPMRIARIPQVPVRRPVVGGLRAGGAKVFVGGMQRTTTEDAMNIYFSLFGTVVSCEVMRRDGVSRGFGFVVFSNDQEAAYVLAQPSHVLDGKVVECKPCQPKPIEGAAPHRPVGLVAPAYGVATYATQYYATPLAARYRPY